MKPPAWKRLLSYILELHVESTSSQHNPHLYVSLKKGRYQLCTANAVYSYGDLYDNFSNAFQQMDLERANIKTVLVLGLGLGSIPLILEKCFKKLYHYTAIEIDEEVVYLASKYTLPQMESPVEVVCTDALAYVQQCRQKFDLVAVDLFIDDVIPDDFQKTGFLEQLGKLISPGGTLLYNHLAYTPCDVENARTFYESSFKQVFRKGTVLKTKGNWMMVSSGEWLTACGS